ncbi:MAG: ABC transporter substrate-binding protein [Thermoleophilaceae bacterium]|nr:ABC transporter substrate-binding protein [Thermoleophilaceae bacterium]
MLALTLLAGCGGESARDPARVTLALDFVPNAAHAGIYGAVASGAAEERGVALRIRTPSASTDGLKLLASGRADLAVLDIHDLGLARERGEDVKGIAAVVQRPLAAVIARPPVRTPEELEGERVGVTGLPSDEAVLRAVVQNGGGDPHKVDSVTIGFSAVQSLVAKRVAAATAFWNVEGVTLRDRGVRTREFRVEDYGAPAYPELVLVTTPRAIAERREEIEDTLEAIAEGVEFTARTPEPVVAAIAEAGGARPAAIESQLRAVETALSPPLTLNRARLREWAEFDVRFGILKRRPDVDATFDFSLAPPA